MYIFIYITSNNISIKQYCFSRINYYLFFTLCQNSESFYVYLILILTTTLRGRYHYSNFISRSNFARDFIAGKWKIQDSNSGLSPKLLFLTTKPHAHRCQSNSNSLPSVSSSLARFFYLCHCLLPPFLFPVEASLSSYYSRGKHIGFDVKKIRFKLQHRI